MKRRDILKMPAIAAIGGLAGASAPKEAISRESQRSEDGLDGSVRYKVLFVQLDDGSHTNEIILANGDFPPIVITFEQGAPGEGMLATIDARNCVLGPGYESRGNLP